VPGQPLQQRRDSVISCDSPLERPMAVGLVERSQVTPWYEHDDHAVPERVEKSQATVAVVSMRSAGEARPLIVPP
jgi:hypothetical protein